MTHLLSNLPKVYDKIVENLEIKLYDDRYLLTIKNVYEKFLAKFNGMNMRQ